MKGKKGLFYNLPLSFYYLLFSSFAGLIIILFFIGSAISEYVVFNKTQDQLMNDSANRIESNLENLFFNTHRIQTLVGKQIVQHNNLAYITRILQNYVNSNNPINKYVVWTMGQWADVNDNIVAAGGPEPIKPINISHRAYLKDSKLNPWKFTIAKSPLIGVYTHEWCLISSLSVNDKNKKNLGSIIIAFNINALTKMLKNALNSSQISFVLINDQGKIILSSQDDFFSPDDIFFSKQKSLQKALHSKEGKLEKPLEQQDFEYRYYKKMRNFPFYIFIGLNKTVSKKGFGLILRPLVIQVLVVSFLCLLLFYFFKRMVIKPIYQLSLQADNLIRGNLNFNRPPITIRETEYLSKALLKIIRYTKSKARMLEKIQTMNQQLLNTKHQLEYTIQLAQDSDLEKEKFVRQIQAELKIPIDSILYFCDCLSNQFERKEIFLQQIKDFALELQTFTRSILTFEKIDIKTLIEECIRIHSKIAFRKKIEIKLDVPSFIPQMNVDPLRLKQAIVGLLYRAVENTPLEGKINIACLLVDNNDLPIIYLKIIIQDTGFGLTEIDCKRMKERFSQVQFGFDITEIELQSIKRIIELHQGFINIEAHYGQGTCVTILLPFEPNNSNNIVHFNKKNKTM